MKGWAMRNKSNTNARWEGKYQGIPTKYIVSLCQVALSIDSNMRTDNVYLFNYLYLPVELISIGVCLCARRACTRSFGARWADFSLFFVAITVTYIPQSVNTTPYIVTPPQNDARQREGGHRQAQWQGAVCAPCFILLIPDMARICGDNSITS